MTKFLVPAAAVGLLAGLAAAGLFAPAAALALALLLALPAGAAFAFLLAVAGAALGKLLGVRAGLLVLAGQVAGLLATAELTRALARAFQP